MALTVQNSDDMEQFNSVVSSKHLRATIEALSSKAPRFLFRAWGSDSGDFLGLNTPESICPLAFRWGNGPKSIHQIPRKFLVDIACRHLWAENTLTVFSSWSQSLETVIRMSNNPNRKMYNPHISIVDTKRLKKENVALYTSSMKFISDEIPDCFKDEFLIFGVVSGDAHKAIPFSQIEAIWANNPTTGLTYEDGLLTSSRGIRVDLLHAHEVATEYGGDFVLPLTLYILCLQKRSAAEMNYALKMLAGCDVPASWCNDFYLLGFEAFSNRFPKTEQANLLLKKLVHVAHTTNADLFARLKAKNLTTESEEYMEKIDDEMMAIINSTEEPAFSPGTRAEERVARARNLSKK